LLLVFCNFQEPNGCFTWAVCSELRCVDVSAGYSKSQFITSMAATELQSYKFSHNDIRRSELTTRQGQAAPVQCYLVTLNSYFGHPWLQA